MLTEQMIRQKQGEDKYYTVENVRVDNSDYNDKRDHDNNPFLAIECTSDQRNAAYVEKYIGRIGRSGPRGVPGKHGVK